jgi:hypothetical protein
MGKVLSQVDYEIVYYQDKVSLKPNLLTHRPTDQAGDGNQRIVCEDHIILKPDNIHIISVETTLSEPSPIVTCKQFCALLFLDILFQPGLDLDLFSISIISFLKTSIHYSAPISLTDCFVDYG